MASFEKDKKQFIWLKSNSIFSYQIIFALLILGFQCTTKQEHSFDFDQQYKQLFPELYTSCNPYINKTFHFNEPPPSEDYGLSRQSPIIWPYYSLNEIDNTCSNFLNPRFAGGPILPYLSLLHCSCGGLFIWKEGKIFGHPCSNCNDGTAIETHAIDLKCSQCSRKSTIYFGYWIGPDSEHPGSYSILKEDRSKGVWAPVGFVLVKPQ